jgi:hypothetical protein
MPTILRLDGMRVVIYPSDHRPEHVHVIGPEVEAVFELRCPTGPVALRESYGFATAQLRRVMNDLNTALLTLCSAWESIHGFD